MEKRKKKTEIKEFFNEIEILVTMLNYTTERKHINNHLAIAIEQGNKSISLLYSIKHKHFKIYNWSCGEIQTINTIEETKQKILQLL